MLGTDGGGIIYFQRKGLAASFLDVDMEESKRSTDSFWIDTVFVALGVIALFASVALGLAILMAE